MILTVIRPAYFPTIAVIAKAMAADVLVWADSFQYKKHDTMNRTAIKTVGRARWLTVPVLSKGLGLQPISAVQIDNRRTWQKNHRRALELNYKMAPYFYQYWDELEDMLSQEHEKLSELDLISIAFAFRALGMKKTLLKSSQLPQVKDRTGRVIAWMKDTQCHNYLYESREASLIDRSRIEKEGVQAAACHFAPVVYHQQFGEFLPDLTILDLLFNEGEQSLNIVNEGISASSADV